MRTTGRTSSSRKGTVSSAPERTKLRTAFFQAKARLDALEKRRDVWRGEQNVIELRQEEGAAEDLLQARHLAGT